ncbi:thioredoxin family protein [Aquimarina algicola]|uniref:Thioredoxin domain-containing protein n=1 Tax=Aquimarina algicola TaxID=2589995 RepID=A0A504JJL8_9FLAO|nr:thioredoxin family protein [Aquimarina algicola]TPN86701.1 hypothetical protein FHK87_03630 [Aquimarina algicola]
MKKHTFLTLLLIVLYSTSYAQVFNHEVIQQDQPPMLLGKINNEKLSTAPYDQWFLKNYDDYAPQENSVITLKTLLPKYTISIFMGTWCGDSKREVPRFYKILKESNFPLDRLTTVAVGRNREDYKQSPGGEQEGLGIHRVPTFIIYKDGKEVNRIVESPKNTLEKDLIDIITKEYTPNYESVQLMHGIISEHGIDYLNKNTQETIDLLKHKTTSLYELNTYASVLFYSHKQNDALAVLHFNTLLFPEEADVYISLAKKYDQLKNVKKAITYYKKALQFEDNSKIKDKIKELQQRPNQG